MIMGAGAIFLFKKQKVVVVSAWCGKLAVCIFYAAMFAMIAFPSMSDSIKITVCCITVVATLFAICKYFHDYMKNSERSVSMPAAAKTIE